VQVDSSLIACAGLAGLKRLAVSKGVMQVSQVTMQRIILDKQPMPMRDRNVTTLLRWAPELKLHQFQTVEGALCYVSDTDVMDNYAFVVHDILPPGDYIFFPFKSSESPSRPCFWASWQSSELCDRKRLICVMPKYVQLRLLVYCSLA
jgi:hypothetical protein